jgi:hypothetical protein
LNFPVKSYCPKCGSDEVAPVYGTSSRRCLDCFTEFNPRDAIKNQWGPIKPVDPWMDNEPGNTVYPKSWNFSATSLDKESNREYEPYSAIPQNQQALLHYTPLPKADWATAMNTPAVSNDGTYTLPAPVPLDWMSEQPQKTSAQLTGLPGWTPGQYGKGIVTPLGAVYHWGVGDAQDGRPEHSQVIHKMGYSVMSDGLHYFAVHPTGAIRYVVGDQEQVSPEICQKVENSAPEFHFPPEGVARTGGYGQPVTAAWRFAWQYAAPGHALWWKPGTPGRGFITPQGHVHTWPEEEGTHESMATAKGIPWEDVRRSSFLTRPDGQTCFPWASALVKRPPGEEATWMNQLQDADSRLKPISYVEEQGIAQAYGSVWKFADKLQEDHGTEGAREFQKAQDIQKDSATDANHWMGKQWHGSDQGHLGPVRTPLWTTSHKPEAIGFGGGEGVGIAHPVQVRLKNPAYYFGKRTPGDIEMARQNGNDGIVVHYPEDDPETSEPYPKRQHAIVLNPGAVVPGHDHDWPYD